MSSVATRTDLADLAATELLAAYAAGETTPVEATQACLARFEQVEPAINAVLLPLAERALAQAEESTRRWRTGEARTLEGVPYGLKDIIATEGVPTTGGSALYRELVPAESAALAERLEAAGGILLAKLQTFEFACGGPDNRTFGIVRNPWDLARTTGGSSSGSGAAVAAAELPVAIGTDTGGSIRIPCAYCGINGIKATFGRVPRHGVMGLSWTMDHAGPMTRSTADTALVLGVVAGRDERDPTSSSKPVPDYAAAVERPATGMRVGRATGWIVERMHPEVAATYEASLAALGEAGATIVDVELPFSAASDAASWAIIFSEMLSLHRAHFPKLEERDAMGAMLLSAAPFVHASDYLLALRARNVFQQELEAAFEGLDAVATPANLTIAPLLEDMHCDLGDELVPWLEVATRTQVPFNLTGNPALILPAGLVDGLPVGLQLVGRPHDESTLFTLGAAFERVTDHHRRRPPLVSTGGSA